MSEILNRRIDTLRAATSLSDLANLLDVTPKNLAYVLYHTDPDALYRDFSIPKRRGGSRIISAPTPKLKLIQRRCANLLQDCLEEIEAERAAQHRFPRAIQSPSHGFRRDRSIRSNGNQHRSRRFVFNIDLEDFFPSINFGRVYGLFLSDREFALNKRVAAVLAAIACNQHGLPQGSPCSPVVSNLIGRILDSKLVRLASRNGCTYSRYADDITFSTNKPSFPREIALFEEVQTHRWHAGNELVRAIASTGFRINAGKTRMQYRDSRQEVTGLVVNKRVNVRAEYRHAVRAMVHRLLKTGSFEMQLLALTDEGTSSVQTVPGSMSQLNGMLGFIERVDKDHLDSQSESITNGSKSDARPQSSIEKLYKSFLAYRHFFAIDRPIILCEGITDNIYLRSAMRILRSYDPRFVRGAGDSLEFAVNFYKYRGTSTDRILGLTGGTPLLTNFISYYKKILSTFSGGVARHPLIIIVDNDKSGRGVMSRAGDEIGSFFGGGQSYAHLFGNLYIIATHLGSDLRGDQRAAGGKSDNSKDDSCMELYFPQEVRDRKLMGRTLTLSNDPGVAHYSKMEFATKIVQRLTEPADFGLMGLMLDRISAVIDAHAELVGRPAS